MWREDGSRGGGNSGTAAAVLLPPLLLVATAVVVVAGQLETIVEKRAAIRPNEVVEKPLISCAADAIYAKLRTVDTFQGHVNVRGAPNRFCYQVLVTNNQIEVLVPHQQCALHRSRTSDPVGVVIKAELLVSFHATFVTAGDRLISISCIYTREELPGYAEPTAAPSTIGFPAPPVPHCEYTVVDERSGRAASLLTVGSVVRHEWRCTDTEDCMRVTSCSLVTADSRHELVDETGCSLLDEGILPQIDYPNRTTATLTTRVFGIAARPLVHFECELSLVPPEERTDALSFRGSGCRRPTCLNARSKLAKRDTPPLPPPIVAVRSQRLVIEEVEQEPRDRVVERAEEECLLTATHSSSYSTTSLVSSEMFCFAPVVALAILVPVVLIAATSGVLLVSHLLSESKRRRTSDL